MVDSSILLTYLRAEIFPQRNIDHMCDLVIVIIQSPINYVIYLSPLYIKYGEIV